MAFTTALSGVNAAQSDLDVISNNIANSSTTGFKSGRAEFGDMYAQSLLGTTTRDTYRGLGAGVVTYGLVAREGEAVDSGYRSRMSVPDFKRNYSGRLQ